MCAPAGGYKIRPYAFKPNNLRLILRSDFTMIRPLTFLWENAIVTANGELSERFKELVLKTSDSERNLGFESLTLRQRITVILT